ncbi:SRPBCC family protein [Devosia albogilva]|uniref:SRPBCC family protein n=1 Tax=Devosia albogilva TaxID=429726 RepID=A0ABW5QFV7_9HYPH
MTTTAIAPVMKTVRVRASPNKAFRFFTENLSKWWPSNFSIGTSPMRDAKLEPRVGGRWYEVGEDGSTCQWGEVLEWNPPESVVLAWRIGADWRYHPDLLTEVAVTFRPVGDIETEVTLEHRKLENYEEAGEQMVGIFSSPDGWSVALDRLAQAIEEANSAG